MKVNQQKELASKVLNAGKDRIWLDPDRLDEIGNAITRQDIKNLARSGAIKVKPEETVSKHRVRKREIQKKKGRQKGPGKRKGSKNARTSSKEKWITKIRALRKELRNLIKKKKVEKKEYRKLYKMAKSGSLRNKNHLYLQVKKVKESRTLSSD